MYRVAPSIFGPARCRAVIDAMRHESAGAAPLEQAA